MPTLHVYEALQNNNLYISHIYLNKISKSFIENLSNNNYKTFTIYLIRILQLVECSTATMGTT